MSQKQKYPAHLSESAKVDEQSVQPFTRSRKIYVQGSRPDIQVPMREISLDEINHLAQANQQWREKAAKAQAVPEGFVLMPIKPTKTMVMAVVKEHEGDAFLPYSLYDAYVKQAMIEAQGQK